MSTVQATNLKHGSSATNNIVLDASGNTTISGNAVVTGTLQANGVTGSVYPLVQGTAVASTSGTSIDFTGIPSWVERITVMFNGVSTNGTNPILIRLGTSGGVEATGYAGAVTSFNAAALTTENSTVGIQCDAGAAKAATTVRNGAITITLFGTNGWAASGNIGSSNTTLNSFLGFFKTVAGTLDRVQITTASVDTFDAGSINIVYE